jgi:hypothetical protein
MKLTLEKAELIQLIGNSLGYTLQEEDVTVVAQPFEVRIQNVNLAEVAAQKTPPALDPADVGDFLDSTGYSDEENQDEAEEEVPEEIDTAANVMTMGDILTKNASMGGPTPDRRYDDEGELGRRLGPEESVEPPDYTQEEISAAGRQK